MEFWQIITALVGALGGLSAIIMFFVFIKQNKRIKDNEADSGEIENLRSIIEELQKDRDSMRLEIESLKRSYSLSETEKIEIESLNNKYKRAFNCQSECDILPSKCPIIIKYEKLK